jgi:hypothetical protein
LKREELLAAASRTGGIQAQVMSAAALAFGARLDGLTPKDVESGLWEARTLIKTWAMRATLHLLPASEFPLYVAARSLDEPRNWVRYFDYYGISQSQYESYLDAATEILGSEPLTREQFAAAVAGQTGIPELQDLLVAKGWGTPLKPLAWRGYLCFGPNQGRNVTFVNPRKWICGWQEVDPERALREIARRYLRSFGPATVKNFSQWWGMRLTPARKLFRSIEDELEMVDVEGWQAWALRETLDPMQSIEEASSINLLPFFDAYVMGIGRGSDIEPLLPKIHYHKVYRPQGWISAVVLFGGRMKGTWEYENGPSQTIIKVRMFSAPTSSIQRGIEAEVERLSHFWRSKVVLEYEG